MTDSLNGANGTGEFLVDRLEDDLRRIVAEIDPVPEDVRAAARAAFTTRNLDHELAVLLADSAAADGDADPVFEPVRTDPSAQRRRLLTFGRGDVQVDVEVSVQGNLADIVGQFSGVATHGCVLEYADGQQRPIDLDPLGRFLVAGVPRGTVRARFRSAGGAPMTTAWVTL